MGEVLRFTRISARSAAADACPTILPDFENLFLSNLIVRLGDRGFASLARAISDSAANTSGTPDERTELDGLVDLGLKFLTVSTGSPR
jgi:hypothetical protein